MKMGGRSSDVLFIYILYGFSLFFVSNPMVSVLLLYIADMYYSPLDLLIIEQVLFRILFYSDCVEAWI